MQLKKEVKSSPAVKEVCPPQAAIVKKDVGSKLGPFDTDYSGECGGKLY